MPDFLLLVVFALVVAAVVFGVAALVSGADPGLTPVEPDGVSRGLPGYRPLSEADLHAARFDTALRGYRMAQVDATLARAAYDIGFKQEMIEALLGEVTALRDGRTEDAEVLRKARESATGAGAGDEPAAGHGPDRAADAPGLFDLDEAPETPVEGSDLPGERTELPDEVADARVGGTEP
ncbi:MAG: DivIVA domain-containing protein, partial [Micromonosporaceae bacterium]